MSRDASVRCWPISRERNVLGRPKLVEWLSSQLAAHPQAIMRSSFKAKDGVRRLVSQTNAVTRPATAETETVSYLLNGKTYVLQNWYASGHALSTVTRSYKAVKLGSCTRVGHTVSAAPGGHAACEFYHRPTGYTESVQSMFRRFLKVKGKGKRQFV